MTLAEPQRRLLDSAVKLTRWPEGVTSLVRCPTLDLTTASLREERNCAYINRTEDKRVHSIFRPQTQESMSQRFEHENRLSLSSQRIIEKSRPDWFPPDAKCKALRISSVDWPGSAAAHHKHRTRSPYSHQTIRLGSDVSGSGPR